MSEPLIEVRQLKKWFWTGKGLGRGREVVRAVDDISFGIPRREVLGLVGESGCGKTTCGKVILRILEPTDGQIWFEGRDITALRQKELIAVKQKMMIIYQDPYGSLDPRMTVGAAIAEPMEVHRTAFGKAKTSRVAELMEIVGLTAGQMNRYPHEFSGGQRQRIGIARALATSPEFVVADESVSALDVSIQAGMLNLLKDLQKEFGLTLLFISHDLSVIKHISDRVAVMYLGKIVEIATKRLLFSGPKHPYTNALFSAIPVPDPRRRRKQPILMGDVPSPVNPPPGCRFHTRCPHVMDVCRIDEPALTGSGEQQVACHLYPEG